jgi:hypothetical protein
MPDFTKNSSGRKTFPLRTERREMFFPLFPFPHSAYLKIRAVRATCVTGAITAGRLDSSVGIATGYGPDDRRVGVRVPVEA